MNLTTIRTKSARIKLRPWQQACRDAHRELVRNLKTKNRFLAAVATGAGKTVCATSIVVDDLLGGHIERVLILTSSLSTIGRPTALGKPGHGWMEALAQVGVVAVEGDNDKLGYNIPEDARAVLMHYASAAMGGAAAVAEKWLGKKWKLVLDEPQHLRASKPEESVEDMDDEERAASAWGKAVEFLLTQCESALLLTATPVRSDKERVPGMSYTPIENSDDFTVDADYNYDYASAYADGWVREILFSCLNAEGQWLEEGELQVKAFDDKGITRKGRTRQMAMFLDAKSEPFRKMFIGFLENIARQRADDVKQGLAVPQAAGMAVCRDRKHIAAIVRVFGKDIERILGAQAVCVQADDSTSRKRIEEFRGSTDPLILSIGMVAEGTDIPRLRSLCFATNKLTRLHFVQVVGRTARVVFLDGERNPATQNADVFMPAHPWLVHYSEEFKNLHKILKAKKDMLPPPPGPDNPTVPIDSRSLDTSSMVATLSGKQQVVSAAGRAFVENVMRKAGTQGDWVDVYKVLLATGGFPAEVDGAPTREVLKDDGKTVAVDGIAYTREALEELTHTQLRRVVAKAAQYASHRLFPGADPALRNSQAREHFNKRHGLYGANKAASEKLREGAPKSVWIDMIFDADEIARGGPSANDGNRRAAA